MTQKINKETTLNEMARLMDVNKSKLSYYVSKGLLTPKSCIGGMYLFDRTETMRRLRRINKLREKDYTLKQIKILLN